MTEKSKPFYATHASYEITTRVVFQRNMQIMLIIHVVQTGKKNRWTFFQNFYFFPSCGLSLYVLCFICMIFAPPFFSLEMRQHDFFKKYFDTWFLLIFFITYNLENHVLSFRCYFLFCHCLVLFFFF